MQAICQQHVPGRHRTDDVHPLIGRQGGANQLYLAGVPPIQRVVHRDGAVRPGLCRGGRNLPARFGILAGFLKAHQPTGAVRATGKGHTIQVAVSFGQRAGNVGFPGFAPAEDSLLLGGAHAGVARKHPVQPKPLHQIHKSRAGRSLPVCLQRGQTCEHRAAQLAVPGHKSQHLQACGVKRIGAFL